MEFERETNTRSLPGELISNDPKLGQVLMALKICQVEHIAEALRSQEYLRLTNQKVFKLGEILLFSQAINLNQLHQALRTQNQKSARSKQEIEGFRKQMAKQQAKKLGQKNRAEDAGLWNRFLKWTKN